MPKYFWHFILNQYFPYLPHNFAIPLSPVTMLFLYYAMAFYYMLYHLSLWMRQFWKRGYLNGKFSSVQFSSVSQSPLTLCNPMHCSLPVHHQLPEFTQTHIRWVSDAIQPSHPLLSPSPPALNLSQHQGLFKWVSSLHQVAKVLEFQLQQQSFQWTPRTDL